MECVGCTACIDACDEVMDVLHFDKGLIRYASENEISTGKKFHFNSRMKAYTILCGILIVFMGILVGTRKTVDTQFSRVKGQLYQETNAGIISNLFDAKIINKTRNEIPITLKVLGDKNGVIELVGNKEILLKKEAINELTFFLKIPKNKLTERSTKIQIGVFQEGKLIQSVATKFLGPFK
jgi:polyferredoxin